jgi:S-adenosylmethionine synthetase
MTESLTFPSFLVNAVHETSPFQGFKHSEPLRFGTIERTRKLPNRYLFTSESVTEGHPDKICDQISDTILDALLSQDPTSRVAAEVVVNTGLVLITGEISTQAHVNYVALARQKIAEIGYVDPKNNGFSTDSCSVMVALDEQSQDIAQGVDQAHETRELSSEERLDSIGAGDQGIMFGFACNETPEYMPLPISLAHRISRQLSKVRKSGQLPYLRPDGKTQVTVIYEQGKPIGIDTVLVSTQHTATIDDLTDEADIQARIKADLWDQVVLPIFGDIAVKPDANTRFLVNPTGKFVIGGPQGDSGLTGRKIIVDTYGGYSRHGGGAFSGKDPTKVDRSAAYACRYVAKNIVAAGLAEKCEVQLSYAIGVARPVSIFVDTFGTGKVSDDFLLTLVKENFELRPAGIIAAFDLQNLPAQRGGRFYQDVAAYGHFGRPDLDLPWEKVDKAVVLQQAVDKVMAAGV